ncbi:MAG: TrkH family potassium uptake protein [Rhodospirillales bacterium]
MATLAIGMCLPAIIDIIRGDDDWKAFAASAAGTFFIGISLILTCRGEDMRLTIRQAFLLTSLSWVVLTTFAALPFMFSKLELSYTDSFFEAMSGITTTGATVITGLDFAPPGILLWRAVLQWLGGIGIIVMAIAVLPMLRVGGMQLFRMESSDQSEKVLPRAAQIASSIGLIYVGLTLVWAVMLWFAGMGKLEAVAHAMTTIATAGFSTADASIGHFDSAAIDWIITFGMMASALPFVLYLQAFRGQPFALIRDTQVRWFFSILGAVIASLVAWQTFANGEPWYDALRYVSFNVVSVMTGTGYATADYDQWGTFALVMFFVVMFIGGCAGSTTCGIKIFRFQVLYAMAAAQMKTLLQPHGVFIPYYNRRPISETVGLSVLTFFFTFVFCFGVLAMGLGLAGLDFLTAVSGAATAISNVGPGLGPIIGPSGNFATLPDSAKWMLSAGMLIGRLEVLTVLILLTPAFWKE